MVNGECNMKNGEKYIGKRFKVYMVKIHSTTLLGLHSFQNFAWFTFI